MKLFVVRPYWEGYAGIERCDIARHNVNGRESEEMKVSEPSVLEREMDRKR